jgi:hypothetical protein
MQTGPTNLVNMPTGQTNGSGQLDAFDKAQHIHPNFNSHIDKFSEIYEGHLCAVFIFFKIPPVALFAFCPYYLLCAIIVSSAKIQFLCGCLK